MADLNALVSPHPFDAEAVDPFIAFDLRRFRFVDDLAVIAGLDARRDLLKLTPTEFEHLVKQLFLAMGAEAWRIVPSKDGVVDAAATSKSLFFGGVCLIQAKRWTGVVGLEAVMESWLPLRGSLVRASSSRNAIGSHSSMARNSSISERAPRPGRHSRNQPASSVASLR